MTNDKPTQKEIEEAKERIRKIALKNLKAGNLMNLASAFLVHKSKAYGQGGNSAVHEFKYWPSFNSNLKNYDLESGEEENLFKNAILKSRQEDEIYSGNVSELGIMKDCAEIMQNSLDQIKISDLYSELMGGSKKVKGELKDVYIGELMPKIPKEEFNKLTPDKKEALQKSMELHKVLVDSYQSYLTDKAVSESLGERKSSTLKNVENILTED